MRLRAISKSPDPPAGRVACEGAEHPDANLISGFVENALTEKERAQVLTHLNQCAECREIAAVALPESDAVAERMRAVVPARWITRPVVRWAIAAAATVVLAIVVVTHPGAWKRRQEIAKLTAPAAPAERGAHPEAQSVAPPAPQSAPPSAKPDIHGEEHTTGRAVGVTGGTPQPTVALDQSQLRGSAQVRRESDEVALSRAPAPAGMTHIAAATSDRAQVSIENKVAAKTGPAPPLPSPPSDGNSAASNQEKSALGQGPPPREPAAPGLSSSSTQGMLASTSAVAAPAQAAPRVAEQASPRMTAQAGISGFRALHKAIPQTNAAPAALWNVSPEGKVRRSTDGGNSWQAVEVGDGSKLLAVAALAKSVWAGGMDGALFHSIDGGVTWARVNVILDASAVTDSITGIQASDQQHVTVTTASGRQLASEDGGQHWQEAP